MRRLQSRILLAYALLAVLVVILVGGTHSLLMSNLFARYVEDSVAQNMQAIKVLVENHYERTGSLSGISSLFRGRGMVTSAIIIADEAGIVVAGPMTSTGQQLSTQELSLGLPLIVQNRRVGTLLSASIAAHVAGVRSLEQEFQRSFLLGSLAAGAAVLVLAVLLGRHISTRLLSPLAELDRAATTLGSGRLEYRIDGRYHDQELQNLVNSFNHMAEKLERNENSRRHLVADVAHELRTPLTILRASLESMLAGVTKPGSEQIASLYDEAARLGRLVDDLLELSLAESRRLSLNIAPNAIDGQVTRVTENLRPYAEDQGVRLVYNTCPTQATARIDPDRFRQVLFNLVYNAVQYNRPEGLVTVEVTATEHEVRVSVTDTGSGIHPDDLPHVFDRFYRGDRARQRTGSGLGLALARELTEAMHGEIQVSSVYGEGSTFVITFPAA